ncbi:MAG: class I SAM-dependent methyltransferase [Planctomycetes bacterium]|nr:class I SAM-dependent methyltransferase [Planctomycetota bacterium]
MTLPRDAQRAPEPTALRALPPIRPLPFRAAWARRLAVARLRSLRNGRLTFEDAVDGERFEFGAACSADDAVVLRIASPTFWTALVARGSLGAAESFVDGAWDCDDLTRLVRVMLRNRAVLDGLDSGLTRLVAPLLRLGHALRANTRRGSRRNIAEHYDLGNEFFESFLDPTLTYSCGVFEREDATMAEASIAKIDRLCLKLDLQPGDRLLEIGTGWGALAMHAARVYGCHVTTTTISQEQYEGARARIAAAGLGDRIDLRRDDYRDLRGRFDKLVHCEMVEAVGAPFLPRFLGRCAELLEPHGVLAMQAITIADQHYARALREVDFIKRWVFPGSFIPSTTALLDAATAGSDLRLVHFEEFGVHYARTLRLWRERFLANREALRASGRSERFLRLWEYYLRYCEAGFAERFLGLGQYVFARPDARPSPILSTRAALSARLPLPVA